MRALVFIFILLVIAGLAGLMSGYVNITNLKGEPPKVIATRSSVTIKGGEPPTFDVQAGSVKVGTKEAKVNVPTVTIRKPGKNPPKGAINNEM